MAKSKGPYFEFYLQNYEGSYEFVFAPGNSSKHVFEETRKAIIGIFRKEFGEHSVIEEKNDYEKNNSTQRGFLRKITLEDGTPSVAIYQLKALQVFQLILGARAFRDFKIKVTGIDKDGTVKEKILINSVQALEAKEVIPYYNKNNNDITTRRRK